MDSNPFLGRTDQLDSRELDSELSGLMTSQLSAAFRFFGPVSNPIDRYGPEISVALKFVLTYWTVFKSNATTGQSLLKIRMEKVIESRSPHKAPRPLLGSSGLVLFGIYNYYPSCDET